MRILALLIIAIIFLAGCINQTENNNINNTIPSSTASENVTQPENTSTTQNTKTYDVAIRNFVYSLTITNIRVGDSVKWTNYDVNAHSATADDGSFDTGLLNKGESKTIVFNTIGTYNYNCVEHSWMFGKIVVK